MAGTPVQHKITARSVAPWLMLLGFVTALGSAGACFRDGAPQGLLTVVGIEGLGSLLAGMFLYVE
jgi:hypothetical protein